MAEGGGAPKVKEDLSRMQAAYGAKMVGKLKKLAMAVFGLDGVGIETVKNLLLTGPGAVTVHDDTLVTPADLGVNFYLTAEDVGKKTRAQACTQELQSINPNVTFGVASGEVTTDTLKQFNVVVFTDDRPLSQLVEFSNFCHENGIAFIYAAATGLFGSVFTDFGVQHEVFDKNGEQDRAFPIESIYISEATGLVEIVLDSDEIKLLDDDGHIALSNVAGMEGINGAMVQIKVDPKNKRRVSVQQFYMRPNAQANWAPAGDGSKFAELVKGFGAYESGGVVKTVKVPEFFDYKTFGESLTAPKFAENHLDSKKQIFFGFGLDNLHATRRTLLEFQEANGGALPKLHDETDAKRCVAEFAPKVTESVDAEMVTKAALFARARFNGVAAFLGGVVAQEAMKKTGKYTPINQWLHFDVFELLPTVPAADMLLDPASASRYDHQISLFGRSFQEKVSNLKVFMVGCGALGCEYLKNLALMGVGCSADHAGELHITDDDVIELSNLSRQFLFRRHHVKELKSESAGNVVLGMNPALKHGLNVHKTRVEPKTETEFTDQFWDELSFVVNALDNVKARTYTDSKCLLHSTPLFESGTLSSQASLSVHIPHESDHYFDSGAGGGQIAMCTLTNFPYLPSHCVGWAKNMFRDLFEVGPSYYSKLKDNAAAFLKNIGSASEEEQRDMVHNTLQWGEYVKIPALADRQKQIEALAQVGAQAYNNFFDTAIRKLTHAFPKDMGTPGGKPNIDPKTKLDMGPFWRGRKRFPRFPDRGSPRFTSFVFHTACIISDILKIARPTQAEIETVAPTLSYSEWSPEAEGADKEPLENLLQKLNNMDTSGPRISEMEFEKDDDENHHIDWIAAACNERSYNYYIDDSTPDFVRVTAGNILAAIATATAAVCGLQMIEIAKHVIGVKTTVHRGLTMNLASGAFVFEELPDVVKFQDREVLDAGSQTMVQHKVAPEGGFSVWDTIKVHGGADMNGAGLAAHIKGLFPDVDAVEFYANNTQIWADDSSSSKSLKAQFFAAMQSGSKSSHSVKTIKRVRNEIKQLISTPIEGIELFTESSDIFDMSLLLHGPPGTPYEGGLFRVQLTIPSKYPLEAPKLTFKTPIFHSNVTTAGAPCPNLLYGAAWSPQKNIRFMLVQLLELLGDQSPADSLNAAAGQLYTGDPAEFRKAAAAFTKERADPASERALFDAANRQASAETKEEPTEFSWPHNYVIIEGDFVSAADPQVVYDLPRIQLFFDAPAGGATKASTAQVPADSGLGKAIMATEFEIEDETFTPKAIYHISDERSAAYIKACEEEPGFTVAVLCDTDEGVQEIVLLIPDGEAAIAAASPGLSEDHYTVLVLTDIIMAEDFSVSNCVEYRFGPNDSWYVCPTSSESMADFRRNKFAVFDNDVRATPVPCMKSLSRMLANGPVDKIFDPHFLNPDREAWQVTNEDTGKVTDIPRPVLEMRTWNAEAQAFESFDTRLVGAPAEGDEAQDYFVKLVDYLKRNLGGKCTVYEIMEKWGQDLDDKMDELGFTNQWTALVKSIKPSKEGLE